MTVAADLTRKAVEITWDTDVATGDTVDVRATKPDGSDPSTRDNLPNDGRCTYTFPADFHGTVRFTVKGSDGGTDEGEVEV